MHAVEEGAVPRLLVLALPPRDPTQRERVGLAAHLEAAEGALYSPWLHLLWLYLLWRALKRRRARYTHYGYTCYGYAYYGYTYYGAP